MADTTAPHARVAEGELAGAREDGIAVFRNVPYAAPPVGSLRFRPPQPPAPWSGVRPADANGPISAQRPSRLARALGPHPLDVSEDCLTLTIWTPAADDAKRPVLVWLHGGAFLTGGGSLPWYDGGVFARRHGVVVVGVTYRLGALGFLTVPDASPGNLGLRDQIRALEWVRDNVAAFGGDPAQVTLGGQSAGAISTFALMASPLTRGLFRRAILQSGSATYLPDRAAALNNGRAFLDFAGCTAADLATLPLERILDAQAAQAKASAGLANPATPFRPHVDGEVVPDEPLAAALERAGDLDVLIGWTRDEMLAFYANDPAVENLSDLDLGDLVHKACGSTHAEVLHEARFRRPGGRPAELLDLAVDDALFCGSAVLFAERAAGTKPVHLYRFDWSAPANPFGACHCIELPFVFDNHAVWDAPMLAGGDAREMAALGRVVNAAWAAFVRTGNPEHEGLPYWPRYRAPERATLRIDRQVEVAGDLAGVGRGRPWPDNIPL